jgi:hypothetical protein
MKAIFVPSARVHRFGQAVGQLLGWGSVLGVGLTLGCSPEPDTSPVVQIISPTAEQTVPAGSAIDVRFTVGGIDASGPTPLNFQLKLSSNRQPGEGKVRAFLDVSNYLAQTVTIPNDADKFLVPDGITATAVDYIKPGRHKLTLQLYYNDDTKVDPQRAGTVYVNIQ